MKKFEYKIVKHGSSSMKTIEAYLNQEGQDGWELTSTTAQDGNFVTEACTILFFKREIK